MKNGKKRNIIAKSKYNHIYEYEEGKEGWFAKLGKKQKWFKDERDAAKWIDLRLIEQGKEPVNILIRK